MFSMATGRMPNCSTSAATEGAEIESQFARNFYGVMNMMRDVLPV
jgi:hypothetical protein